MKSYALRELEKLEAIMADTGASLESDCYTLKVQLVNYTAEYAAADQRRIKHSADLQAVRTAIMAIADESNV